MKFPSRKNRFRSAEIPTQEWVWTHWPMVWVQWLEDQAQSGTLAPEQILALAPVRQRRSLPPSPGYPGRYRE